MSNSTTCHIYRSKKTDGLYLFLAKEDDFECVPEKLRNYFGVPEKSMELELNETSKLARSKPEEVLQNLKEHGFHIQMPPPNSSI